MPRGPFERGGADRVHEDDLRRLEPARDGRRDDDRAERVTEDDGARRDRRRRTPRSHAGVRVDVVPAARQRRRLAEPGKIG